MGCLSDKEGLFEVEQLKAELRRTQIENQATLRELVESKEKLHSLVEVKTQMIEKLQNFENSMCALQSLHST